MKVSELLPALDGPGGALCGYIEAHAFLASVKEAAEEADERAGAAEVLEGGSQGVWTNARGSSSRGTGRERGRLQERLFS